MSAKSIPPISRVGRGDGEEVGAAVGVCDAGGRVEGSVDAVTTGGGEGENDGA
jgi:hypothetical protein